MTQPKDEWRGGAHTYLRDVGNEQKVNLVGNAGTNANPTPGSKFEGVRRNIAQFPGFLLSYGSNQPFTMRIEFFKEQSGGVSTGSISPQVRGPIGGFYSVISPQPRASFLGPFYRMVIQNGPSAQAFFQNYAILSDEFGGHIVSVDGPIPLLGQGPLGVNLVWGHGTYDPVTKTYVKIPVGLDPDGAPKGTALVLDRLQGILEAVDGLEPNVENLRIEADAIGLNTDDLEEKLEEVRAAIAAIPPAPSSVSIDNLPATYPLPAAQVTTLTPPAFPATYPLPSAQVIALTPPGTVAIANPTANPETGLAKDATLVLLNQMQAPTPFRHLSALGTTLVKSGAGVLSSILVNKYAVASNVTLTLYDSLTATGSVIAAIQVGGIFAGSQTGQPFSLPYNVTFGTGLTAVLSAIGSDITICYR